jgi:hypothetical protein
MLPPTAIAPTATYTYPSRLTPAFRAHRVAWYLFYLATAVLGDLYSTFLSISVLLHVPVAAASLQASFFLSSLRPHSPLPIRHAFAFIALPPPSKCTGRARNSIKNFLPFWSRQLVVLLEAGNQNEPTSDSPIPPSAGNLHPALT